MDTEQRDSRFEVPSPIYPDIYPRMINSADTSRTRSRQDSSRERIDKRNPELAENGYNGDAAGLASPLTDKEEGWFLSEMGFRPTDSRAHFAGAI